MSHTESDHFHGPARSHSPDERVMASGDVSGSAADLLLKRTFSCEYASVSSSLHQSRVSLRDAYSCNYESVHSLESPSCNRSSYASMLNLSSNGAASRSASPEGGTDPTTCRDHSSPLLPVKKDVTQDHGVSCEPQNDDSDVAAKATLNKAGELQFIDAPCYDCNNPLDLQSGSSNDINNYGLRGYGSFHSVSSSEASDDSSVAACVSPQMAMIGSMGDVPWAFPVANKADNNDNISFYSITDSESEYTTTAYKKIL